MMPIKFVLFALTFHLGSGRNVRDLTGQYHGEGTHTHFHDTHSDIETHVSHGVFNPTTSGQLHPLVIPQERIDLPPQTLILLASEEFIEPRCGCVLAGQNQCPFKEKNRDYEAKSTLVCGNKYVRCCYPEDPWPGYTDHYAHVLPCVPEEHCFKKYGDLPTDVAQYGTIPPCPGLGAVRCTDHLGTGGPQEEPVQHSIPILPLEPVHSPSVIPLEPAITFQPLNPTHFEQAPVSQPDQTPQVQLPVSSPTPLVQPQLPPPLPGGFVFPTDFPNFPSTAFNYNSVPAPAEEVAPIPPNVGIPPVAPIGRPIEPYSPYTVPYGYGYLGYPGYGYNWVHPFGHFGYNLSPYGFSVRKSFGKFWG